MRKKLLSLVLVFSIIILSIVPAHAIQDYGITKDWTNNTIITYEALSELAAQVAHDISNNNCPSQFSGSHVDMRYNGTYWHIKVIKPTGDIYYVGAHTGTVESGTGTVYVATASQITQVLWNIENIASTISSKISTVDTHIQSQLNTLEAIYRAMLPDNNIYVGWTTDGDGNNYSTIPISRSAGDAMIANINTNLVGKKATFVSASGTETVVVISYAYIANNGTIRVYCYNSTYTSIDNYTLITKGHPYYVVQSGGSSEAFDDTDLLNAIDELNLDITNSIGDLGVTVNQSISQNLKSENPKIYGAGTSAGSFNISNSTMDAMISFLNSNMLGKPITYVTANSSNEYYLRGAYKSNNRIRVTMEDSNGSAFSTTAYLCNKYRYTYTLDNTSNTVESTILNIPTHIDALGLYLQELGIKLDNIYNWLDNADLVTNQDLEDMIQEFSSDIDNAENNVKNGAKLFKATFGSTDDGYSLGDIISCINTMNDFWEVPD